jgi:tripartite-type tricarboxylate transporter receptor subunit TctC
MRYFTAASRILVVSMLIAIAGPVAAQQAYPSKPIRLITPYPPGGGTSVVARLMSQKLTERWGQQVLVDNRPGGNTIIGTQILVESPPDGYTLILVISTHVIVPSLFSAPYDPIKDFAPVTTLATSDYVLVVHPSVAAGNLKELIAQARANPGQLNYGSTGTGGMQHLAAESLGIMTGIKMQHIPYKGSGQLLPDLIGGQIQLSFQTPIGAIPHIRNGKLKAIAYTGETRLAALPQLPTFAEAGLPGFDMRFWYGILAPAGTPRGIIDKLSTEIGRILAMPDIKETLDSLGTEPFISTPEKFAALMQADMAKFVKIIKTANIKGE